MDKKFQVFISSTYEDLKIERQKVQDIVLSMYQIPIGMEMFSAADEEQWEIIKDHIDNSDFYVLIIGHRYGSVIEDGPDAGISYTEKEYNYAVHNGIPVLAFIIGKTASTTIEKIEKNPDSIPKLQRFVKKVTTGRMVEWWMDADDLSAKVMNSLSKQILRNKRPGWVRASSITPKLEGTEVLAVSVNGGNEKKSVVDNKVTSKNEVDEHRIEATVRGDTERIIKTTFENELRNLRSWINNVNNGLASGMPIVIDSDSANNTCYQINAVANGIEREYPFYTKELKNISTNLFKSPAYGAISLNNAAFGELFIIIKHIVQEPVGTTFWREVHPRIAEIVQGLFENGYYDSATEKAVKELESRLRELLQIVKPGATVPAKIGDILGALLSENGTYQFADLSTTSGKDYRRGIYSLFEGMFAAYRNPSAHENLPCTKREAMEQIMLASQLMYVLEQKGM